MGIEALNSAAAAAGFAMVSEDVATEGDAGNSIYVSSPVRGSSVNLPALISETTPPVGQSTIGARMTGMLESWRAKS